MKGFALVLALIFLAGCAGTSNLPSVGHKDPTVVAPPRNDLNASAGSAPDGPAPSLPTSESDLPAPTPEAVECKNAAGQYIEVANIAEAPHFGAQIHFDSATHGWLAQESPQSPTASLYETADGGKAWSRRVTVSHGFIGDMHWSGPVGVLNAIDLSRSSHPVHLLVITQDRGRTWSVRPCEIAVTTVTAGALTGWYRGQMYLSTDGGERWSRVHSPEGYDIGVDLLILDGTREFVGLFSSGDGNQLFTSRDEGFSWTPITTVDNPSQVGLGADGALWALNSRGLWVSSDAGASWSLRPFPKRPEQEPLDLSLRPVDEHTVWVKIVDRPTFLFTNPSTDSWHTLSLPEIPNAEGSFGFAFGGSRTCVVGDWRLNHHTGTSLWCSTDYGASWVKVSAFDSP